MLLITEHNVKVHAEGATETDFYDEVFDVVDREMDRLGRRVKDALASKFPNHDFTIVVDS